MIMSDMRMNQRSLVSCVVVSQSLNLQKTLYIHDPFLQGDSI